MTTFEQAMRIAGLMPREIAPDGKWRRCPTEDHPRKKNGAYILFPDGHGLYRNWAMHERAIAWQDGTEAKISPIDQRRMEAIRARERDERMKAIQRARDLWAQAQPYQPHTYLADQGIRSEGCAGLRTWTGEVWLDENNRASDKWLCVPIFWRKSLINVQRIGSNGTKRFVAKAPVKGGSFVIERERAALTVFVEGLATGLAVYQCMRHARVIVAFDAGNLLPVVEEAKPSGMVCIAADNDWRTALRPHMNGVNPGIEKARNAASLIDCGVAYPTGIEGSDWADFIKEFGPTSAKKVERAIQAAARYVERPG